MKPGQKHSFTIRENISTLMPYVPGKPIDEVRRELDIERIFKLASNEFPFGPVEAVREAVYRAASELHRYPDSNNYYLKQRLAERFSVSEEEIIFGNGSSELIKLIADCIVEEGDTVIYADPSFVMYPIVAKGRGARVREIPLEQQGLAHDLEAMLEAVDGSTVLIIICNPNNPTATLTHGSDIRRFLERLPEGPFVLFDEAYYEFVTSEDFVDGLTLYKEGWPNIGVLRTFSKAYGLAGLRIGYGFVPPALADAVNRVREPFNINLVAQAAALAALNCEEEYKSLRKQVIEERARMSEKLAARGYRVYESQANFIFFDCGFDSDTVFKKLLTHGIIVRTGAIFGDRYATYLRVSVGTRAENDAFLEALDAVRRELEGGKAS